MRGMKLKLKKKLEFSHYLGCGKESPNWCNVFSTCSYEGINSPHCKECALGLTRGNVVPDLTNHTVEDCMEEIKILILLEGT